MENNLLNTGQNGIMANYKKTDDILKDMCGIIESSRNAAYQAVNTALVSESDVLFTTAGKIGGSGLCP